MSGVITAKVETFLLTECELSSQTDIGAVLYELRREKTSGTLKIELQDGGIRRISISKKTKAHKSANNGR